MPAEASSVLVGPGVSKMVEMTKRKDQSLTGIRIFDAVLALRKHTSCEVRRRITNHFQHLFVAKMLFH